MARPLRGGVWGWEGEEDDGVLGAEEEVGGGERGVSVTVREVG